VRVPCAIYENRLTPLFIPLAGRRVPASARDLAALTGQCRARRECMRAMDAHRAAGQTDGRSRNGVEHRHHCPQLTLSATYRHALCPPPNAVQRRHRNTPVNVWPAALAGNRAPTWHSPRPAPQHARAHAVCPLGTVVESTIFLRSATSGFAQPGHLTVTSSDVSVPGMMPSAPTLKRSPK